MPNNSKPPAQIEANDLEVNRKMVTFDAHLSGGLQAHKAAGGFVVKPTLKDARVSMTGPFSLTQLAEIATHLEISLLGVDQVSERNTPLPCRTWNPLRSSTTDIPAADLWSNISTNADQEKEALASAIARRISFTLHAAGIRVRDCSDHFHRQLLAATEEAKYEPRRFKNIQLFDIRLALHSLLSELASARDYLAWWFALGLGAPENVDALNRLKNWLDKQGDVSSLPFELKEFLDAYSDQSADPWALQLTHFRNLHLHREPIGSGGERDCLRYKVIECGDRSYPLLTYLISDQEKYYSGQDYLKSFFDIYTKISNFAKRVARSAHISCDYPKVTFPKAGER